MMGVRKMSGINGTRINGIRINGIMKQLGEGAAFGALIALILWAPQLF